MGKHSVIDLKKTNNIVAPLSNFKRIVHGKNGLLYQIDDTGAYKELSAPWNHPVISYIETDPSTLTPSNGDRYLVPVGAIGDWLGHDESIAYWSDSTWLFMVPEKGWIVYNYDVNKLLAFDGSIWVSASGADTFGGLSDVTFNRTYSDWFMPSVDELDLIYNQLHLYGLGGYPNVKYWSSSESTRYSAWTFHFGTADKGTGYSKSNSYYTIPIRQFHSKISYAVRDRGPAGGYIIYNSGDYYIEASTHTFHNRWCPSSISNVSIPNTDILIGTGRESSTSMLNAPGYTAGLAIDCDNYTVTINGESDNDIALFENGNWTNQPLGTSGSLPQLSDVDFVTVYDDWYIGSLDLMNELRTFVGTGYSGKGFNGEYWTSTEADAANAWTIRFQNQDNLSRGKGTILPYARPIRDFDDSDGAFAVGDEGPAGGIIFYKNGTITYEVGRRDLRCEKIPWTDAGNNLVPTGSAIGNSLSNTVGIVNQAGHTDSPAKWALEYTVRVPINPSDKDILIYNSTTGLWETGASDVKLDDITIDKNVNDEITIKEIDHIIDDDNESIDGSDTPMSDPHRELVTRAFVEATPAKVDNITIENDMSKEITIKNINYIIDDDGQSIDGSDTDMIDSHSELVTRAYIDGQKYTPLSVRLIETYVNIDLSTPSNPTIDNTVTNDGDLVGLFAQDTPSENGFYVVNGTTGWTPSTELAIGEHVAGRTFVVKEGCMFGDSIQVFTNDDGADVVGTDALYISDSSDSGTKQKTETKDLTAVDIGNNFVDITEIPLLNKHFLVFLNGMYLTANEDYTPPDSTNPKRIVFLRPINLDDKFAVSYTYKEGSVCTPPPSPNTTFEFDVVANAGQNINIYSIKTNGTIDLDWGDGNTVSSPGDLTNVNNTYSSAGTYRVKIQGHYRIQMVDGTGVIDDDITVKHWGDMSAWTSFESMFAFMTDIKIDTDDILHPTNTVSMRRMFNETPNFNSDITDFIMTNVNDIRQMFYHAQAFNQDIGSWDISGITRLDEVFALATSFNGNIHLWDTTNITNMHGLFRGANSFTGIISGWNTSNVTDVGEMFKDNSAFNRDISGWDTSNVTVCDDFRNNAALTCNNVPTLNIACTLCYDKFEFDIDVTSGEQINISVVNGGFVDTLIDWGDGNTNSNNNTAQSNTYTNAGTYHVTIQGHKQVNLSNITNVVKITHWGDDSAWTSFENSFRYMTHLTIDTDDLLSPTNQISVNSMFVNTHFDADITSINSWGMGNVTSMAGMFSGSNFDQDIGDWDVSNVTDMHSMFQNTSFNSSLINWNTSSLIHLEYFMRGNGVFNQAMDHFDTSNVVSMLRTFENCAAFNQPLNSWDVSNVTDFTYMFSGATVFNQPLNNWTPSSATTMMGMFQSASAFNQNIDTWDVSNVTDMNQMFINAIAFNSPLNNWNVTKVNNFYRMFGNASSFNQPLSNWVLNTSEPVDCSLMFSYAYVFNQNIDTWDVSHVTNMAQMFYQCHEYNQPLNSWDVSSVTKMQYMFGRTYKFNQHLDNWVTSSLTIMDHMFWNASVFDGRVNNFDVSNVQNFNNIFGGAEAFDQALDQWDMSSATDLTSMFQGAKAFNQPINTWNVSGVTSLVNTFNGATDFNRPLDNWNIGSCTNISGIFQNAISFNQNINVWNTSNVTNMSAAFSGASVFNQPLNSWDTSSVTNMGYMFRSAVKFDQDLSTWDTSNVTDMIQMFFATSSQGFNHDISSWDVSKVTDMSSMFYNNYTFNQNLNNWDVSKVTTMLQMFRNADAFNQPLNNWDTSSVTTMNSMFRDNDSFDQDISGWDVSNVTDCTEFKGGTSVLQCIHTPAAFNPCTGC